MRERKGFEYVRRVGRRKYYKINIFDHNNIMWKVRGRSRKDRKKKCDNEVVNEVENENIDEITKETDHEDVKETENEIEHEDMNEIEHEDMKETVDETNHENINEFDYNTEIERVNKIITDHNLKVETDLENKIMNNVMNEIITTDLESNIISLIPIENIDVQSIILKPNFSITNNSFKQLFSEYLCMNRERLETILKAKDYITKLMERFGYDSRKYNSKTLFHKLYHRLDFRKFNDVEYKLALNSLYYSPTLTPWNLYDDPYTLTIPDDMLMNVRDWICISDIVAMVSNIETIMNSNMKNKDKIAFELRYQYEVDRNKINVRQGTVNLYIIDSILKERFFRRDYVCSSCKELSNHIGIPMRLCESGKLMYYELCVECDHICVHEEMEKVVEENVNEDENDIEEEEEEEFNEEDVNNDVNNDVKDNINESVNETVNEDVNENINEPVNETVNEQ